MAARLIAIAPAILAAGCATHAVDCQCVDSLQVIEREPPAELLEPCAAPLPPEYITALSAAGYIVDLRRAFGVCAAQIDAIAEFYSE